ncbi:uncharacterized protein METZ01_LOCUS458040 [marine metagenome]|uniref:Uncharacterized protein n=1 Tax=marine metagenome TaxID=408172 RepID=A0A383ABE7_9ZZZZ
MDWMVPLVLYNLLILLAAKVIEKLFG